MIFLRATSLCSDCVGFGVVLICTSPRFRGSDCGARASEREGRAEFAWMCRAIRKRFDLRNLAIASATYRQKVSGLQHDHKFRSPDYNIRSLATFRPTECLMAPSLCFCVRSYAVERPERGPALIDDTPRRTGAL